MFLSEEEKLIREYFDISDPTTRALLLHEDTNNEQLLAALTNALYDKIVSNVDKIDFGSIPRSRGDITKVEGFENTVECLNIMRKIALEYKETPDYVDTVLSAINNVKERKAIFMKGYATNMEFPIMLYNLIVLCIEQSVSYMIAVCIQYIKDPQTGSMAAALDKVSYNNTKDTLLYEQLNKFNVGCSTKQVDIAIDEVFKNAKAVKEAVEDMGATDRLIDRKVRPNRGLDQMADELDDNLEPINGSGSTNESTGINEGLLSTAVTVVGAVANVARYTLYGVKALLGCVIPLMRSVTYFFIHTRVKTSDSLAIQAQFIEANANKLQYSDTSMDENRKKKVVAKQLKIAEKLRFWSNKLAIDNKKSENAANSDMNQEKKTTAGDLNNQYPDEGDSGDLF
jgi:hypothetical protein